MTLPLTDEGIEFCDRKQRTLLDSLSAENHDTDPCDSYQPWEKTVWEEIDDQGWSFMGDGFGRVVFSVPDRFSTVETDIVVKLCRPILPAQRKIHCGDEQTATEYRLFERLKAGKFPQLDPNWFGTLRGTRGLEVDGTQYQHLYSVMDRYTPILDEYSFGEAESIRNRLDERPGAEYIDGAAENIGFSGSSPPAPDGDASRFVWLDYGSISTRLFADYRNEASS